MIRQVGLVMVAIALAGFGGSGSACAETTNAVSEWPIYHGDAALSGVAGTTLPDKLSVRWRFKAGAGVSLPPVVGSNMIFFVTDNGDAYAITLQGVKVWSRGVDAGPVSATNASSQAHRFSSPPLFIGNAVVVGSDDGWLYALESATGRTVWKQKVGDSINGTANWLEPEGPRGRSVVVISQADGSVHRINLAAGLKLWASQPTARSDGSPGVGSDFIAFGSCDSALHFISAAKGEMLGKIALEGDGQVAGGIAVSGDLVFAGTRGGLIVCADARKGGIVWTNQVAKGEAFATPALTADRVVVGSNDGSVYCLSRKDGRKIWSFDAGDNVTSPVVAGDKVVVAAGGTLNILRLADGGRLWTTKPCDLISSPAVMDGTVIVGTDDGFVLMYGAGASAR